PRSPPVPYTTLFRSPSRSDGRAERLPLPDALPDRARGGPVAPPLRRGRSRAAAVAPRPGRRLSPRRLPPHRRRRAAGGPRTAERAGGVVTGKLEGRVALISGIASGLGRAGARLFAAEGAAVVGLDVDADGASRTVAEIVDAGGTGAHVQGDAAQAADVQ